MSKYSEKKERQAKAAFAAAEAEKAAAREAKAAKAQPPTLPKKDDAAEAERISFSRRRATDAEAVRILQAALADINAQIVEIGKCKDECKAEEKSHYYAAFGRLVASRDKLISAISNVQMAGAVANVGGAK